MMKVYIAGKITGDPDNYEKFYTVHEALCDRGYTVLDPVILPTGMEPGDYMRICFAMIECADCVVLLPGWEESKGANLELAYCKYVGKLALSLADFYEWQRGAKAGAGA